MLGIDSDQVRVNLFIKKRGRIYSVKYMQFYLRAEYFESLVNLATERRSLGEVTRRTTFSVM